ncbi:MAG: CoA transferase [Caldilineales bacterium]|nr:CoA transferase [Caldilineales bacterium]MDW8316561.1 CoA transferase [Anaerolineae bacterium]
MPDLHGLRVLDLSRLLPGPYCTALLAAMGADVIKVESPLMGDPARLAPPFVEEQSALFVAVNRGKRSVAVNYRRAEGRDIVHRLVLVSDVFVEAFKPGQAARLGLDFATLSALNPRLIYCSLSGYGQSGPYAQRAGHDATFLALAGALDLLRDGEGEPRLPGFQLADVAGGLFAAIAILAALHERSLTGRGQFLDVSLWESAFSLLALQAVVTAEAGPTGRRALANLQGTLHTYNVYRTADGQHMALAALEPVLWADFCRAVGRDDLAPHYVPGDEAQRQALLQEVAAIFAQRTRAEWEALLADHDVCCEPVLALEEAIGPYRARLGRPPLPTGCPWPVGLGDWSSLSDWTSLRAPRLGQHTAEVLAELGLSPADVEALRQDKVVATAEEASPRRLRGLEAIHHS